MQNNGMVSKKLLDCLVRLPKIDVSSSMVLEQQLQKPDLL